MIELSEGSILGQATAVEVRCLPFPHQRLRLVKGDEVSYTFIILPDLEGV